MYPGNLDTFYGNFTDTDNMDYMQHNSLMLSETTEFSGVYNRKFRQLGINSNCIIANDNKLQGKWKLSKKTDTSQNYQILSDQVRYYRPDVLWFDNVTYADSGLLSKIRGENPCIKLIVGYHCSPYNSKIADLFRNFDIMITCTPGLVNDLKSKGLNAFLVYHGFDTQILEKISKEKLGRTKNLIFSGSLTTGAGFHDDRISFIEAILKANIDIDLYVNLENKLKVRAKQSLFLLSKLIREKNMVKLTKNFPILEYGKFPVMYYSNLLLRKSHAPVFGMDMYNLFNTSRLVLNFHVGVAGNYAGNMRLFEVTGIGSCLLTDNKRNLGDLFNVGSEVVAFDNAEDCIEKARWLLEHDSEREKIAAAGHKRTIKTHTVENRCNLISEILENQMKAKG